MSGKINVLHDEGGFGPESASALSLFCGRLRSKKAQSSMILIIIVIMIFVGMAVFLLGLANTIGKEEFTGLYVNNLLLSVMRTDTGYTDPRCKLVSDLVFCAYFTQLPCGDSRENCLELANSTIAKYMTLFGNETQSLKYLFTVTTPDSIAWSGSGEPVSVDIGDKSLKISKTESLKIFSYPLIIRKNVNSNVHTLKIQLIVSKK